MPLCFCYTVEDIGRAEKGLPPLLRSEDDPALRLIRDPLAPLDKARLAQLLARHKPLAKAQQNLREAIRSFGLYSDDFVWGLGRALRELLMMTPEDSPKSQRDEYLLSAFERGLSKEDVQDAGEVPSIESVDQAFYRARNARKKSK